MSQPSEYVYDTLALFGAEDLELTTIKYQKVSISRTEKGLPNGEQAYVVIIQQLLKEVEDYLRVNDSIGFFVFKRPSSFVLSPHLSGKPFAGAILTGNLNDSKSQIKESIKIWRERAASEYGRDRRRYFGRKHIWLVKRRSPTFIQTIQNPVTIDDGHGGVKREYIDINEECREQI